jgi:hypothetical protein
MVLPGMLLVLRLPLRYNSIFGKQNKQVFRIKSLLYCHSVYYAMTHILLTGTHLILTLKYQYPPPSS